MPANWKYTSLYDLQPKVISSGDDKHKELALESGTSNDVWSSAFGLIVAVLSLAVVLAIYFFFFR